MFHPEKPNRDEQILLQRKNIDENNLIDFCWIGNEHEKIDWIISFPIQSPDEFHFLYFQYHHVHLV